MSTRHRPETPIPPSALAGADLIILAGGVGRRLRHVTRALTGEATPKQFCRFVAGRSLLEETVARLEPLIPRARIQVVVTGAQRDEARRQLPGFAMAQIVAQPSDRGTAVGLLLPLLEIAARDETRTVVVTPADHAFEDSAALARALRLACERVRRSGQEIVLIGVAPDAPRPDLGWIVRDTVCGQTFGRVIRFEEKPSPRRARDLMESGACFNTLILVASVGALLDLFRRWAPDLLAALGPAPFLPSAERAAFLAETFERIASVDLSRDLLAHADNLVALGLDRAVGWTDLGDERRLLRWLEATGERRLAGWLRERLHHLSGTEHEPNG